MDNTGVSRAQLAVKEDKQLIKKTKSIVAGSSEFLRQGELGSDIR